MFQCIASLTLIMCQTKEHIIHKWVLSCSSIKHGSCGTASTQTQLRLVFLAVSLSQYAQQLNRGPVLQVQDVLDSS